MWMLGVRMQNILPRNDTINLLESGVFAPEATALMMRLFNKVCFDFAIDGDELERLDALALIILRAIKSGSNENVVLAIALHAMKNYPSGRSLN